MQIDYLIQALINYALQSNLIKKEDQIWSTNTLISKLHLSSPLGAIADSTRNLAIPPSSLRAPNRNLPLPKYPTQILSQISSWAVQTHLIPNLAASREILETDLMSTFAQRPSDFITTFHQRSKKNLKKALKWLYEKQKQLYYIKADQTAKNIYWTYPTRYGKLGISINLSKPEKTTKEIALLRKLGSKSLIQQAYPKCPLCPQNEGYAGRLDFPSKKTARLIPMKLAGQDWFFQFSPYVYYKEHCILLSKEHKDMQINPETFVRLIDFLEQVPHYFIGSNADLPIVGGSILNHEHYQGGNYSFPLHRAKIYKTFKLKKFPKLKVAVLDWALTVIRLTGSKKDVIAAGIHTFNKWKNYSDPAANIKAYSGKTPHNTLNPIARKIGKLYSFDLILRNNATSKQYPEGIFHIRPQYYNIKRENIGLIEALGLAILPGRLESEMNKLKPLLLNRNLAAIKKDKTLTKHYEWSKNLLSKYVFTPQNIDKILKNSIAQTFLNALISCKTLPQDESLSKFLTHLNQ